MVWLAMAAQAGAHEVQLGVGQAQAAVLRLQYADGQPFAFEAYELYARGQEAPVQVGRTSAAGQIVFIPGPQTDWRLKAWSADGHGVDQAVTVVVSEAAGASPSPTAAPLPRTAWLLAGGGIVFGLFGLIQLFIRRKKA